MGEIEAILEAAKQLDEQDKRELIRRLSRPAPDVWTAGGANERHLAYDAYSKEIASLVAKIEVYAHDLPPFVGALVEYLWHMLAVAASESDPETQEQIYCAIGKYTVHITNELKIILVDLYLKTIQGYKKTLGCFNHQAFVTESGKTVIQEVSSSVKNIKSLSRKAKRVRKAHLGTFTDNGVKNIVVDCEKVCVIKEIADAMDIAEKTIELCEKNYAKIVGNGYCESFLTRVLWEIPNIISFGLAVYGLWVLVQTILPVVFLK